MKKNSPRRAWGNVAKPVTPHRHSGRSAVEESRAFTHDIRDKRDSAVRPLVSREPGRNDGHPQIVTTERFKFLSRKLSRSFSISLTPILLILIHYIDMDISHIEHLGIAVKSIDEQLPYYEQLLGVACYSIEEVADQKVKTAFFRVGQTKIELL